MNLRRIVFLGLALGAVAAAGCSPKTDYSDANSPDAPSKVNPKASQAAPRGVPTAPQTTVKLMTPPPRPPGE